MKTAIFLAGLLIAVGAMAQSDYHQEKPLYAQAGCCKERTGSSGWRIISRNYNQCYELNSRFDGRDDIYRPLGRYWWDPSCR